MTPNLASRPFLNTRPVWLVTAAAGVLSLALIVLNIFSYVHAGSALEPQIAQRDRLLVEQRALAAGMSGIVADLEKVPWKSLGTRIDATNVILREHNFSWLVMLNDLESVMPYDVRILQVSPDVGTAQVDLHLKVVAKTREAMIEFLDNLIADPKFTRPTPATEVTPEQSESGSYQLLLSVQYHPPEESS
jgi:Tfp pilus assembly protein PilN